MLLHSRAVRWVTSFFGTWKSPLVYSALHGASTCSPLRWELLSRVNRLKHSFERIFLICKGLFVFPQIKLIFPIYRWNVSGVSYIICTDMGLIWVYSCWKQIMKSLSRFHRLSPLGAMVGTSSILESYYTRGDLASYHRWEPVWCCFRSFRCLAVAGLVMNPYMFHLGTIRYSSSSVHPTRDRFVLWLSPSAPRLGNQRPWCVQPRLCDWAYKRSRATYRKEKGIVSRWSVSS